MHKVGYVHGRLCKIEWKSTSLQLVKVNSIGETYLLLTFDISLVLEAGRQGCYDLPTYDEHCTMDCHIR